MKENKKNKDLEDTLQYILAKKENCDLIISNDENFYADDIEVISSEEFLKNF
jgi:predicted nucleic acid-binding protein